MEEAQVKLKLLIEKAQNQNINLWEIPAIKQQKKLLESNRKVKIFVASLIMVTLYGKFNGLLNTDKVNNIMNIVI